MTSSRTRIIRALNSFPLSVVNAFEAMVSQEQASSSGNSRARIRYSCVNGFWNRESWRSIS